MSKEVIGVNALATGGGVLLYSHTDIPLSSYSKFDDGTCEVVFCRFDSKKN